MISGDAAEREDGEDERDRDKPNGTQIAPDKIEEAPSGALSQELASDKKGEEDPLSLEETKSPSKNKGVTSQQEHTNILKVITMHSQSESTRTNLEADKSGSTLHIQDERSQDKEDGREDKIPPPTLQKEP
jgi:hypothetical protein